MTDVLDFQDVTVRRGTSQILTDITWRVDASERWVLMGRNGAGKSTLLEIAGARLHPSSGTAWVLGERLGRVDIFELRPRIGYASALLAARIPRDETVRDVILTAAYGVTGRWREVYEELDNERAGDLMRLFGVDTLADRYYGTLSEGERKRTQIARALMTDPELLMLDEPSAGLDLGGREELVAALAELAGDQRSPAQILVTHQVEEIPPGFTHLLLLKDGVVSAAGPIAETLTAEKLSEAFGLALTVRYDQGRWSARAA